MNTYTMKTFLAQINEEKESSDKFNKIQFEPVLQKSKRFDEPIKEESNDSILDTAKP